MLGTVRTGGEGLMLHKASALYRSGRSSDMLKLKPQDHAEAQVVAYSISKSNVDAKAKHGQYGRTASEADKVHV